MPIAGDLESIEINSFSQGNISFKLDRNLDYLMVSSIRLAYLGCVP
ncbi:hypothetical protein Pse7367_3554 [Thalassoporum mexicanum PCC 7367]|nr:hypothetical protein Pse7367_3554 [Pseudanabaena sp. PCC 7367]